MFVGTDGLELRYFRRVEKLLGLQDVVVLNLVLQQFIVEVRWP